MNGKVFQGLGKLIHVFINKNLCIDESFTTRRRIWGMPKRVSMECGFNKGDEDED
jgi:hypothetical protein